jgi:hypothetical protein
LVKQFFFGKPIFFLVNQFFFGQPKTIFSCFWSTNFFFGQPKKKLVNKNNEKLTGRLVDHRD